ncbi:MAG: DUF3135 domain-containing protein [Gammaproteobacteria bacterium]
MKYTLPEFDTLREMAQNDPEGLERLRGQPGDQLIRAHRKPTAENWCGLQFRVDMERRRAKSPMAACIAISAMMHDSFDQLRQALNEAAGNASVMGGSQHDTMTEAKVLPFRRA